MYADSFRLAQKVSYFNKQFNIVKYNSVTTRKPTRNSALPFQIGQLMYKQKPKITGLTDMPKFIDQPKFQIEYASGQTRRFRAKSPLRLMNWQREPSLTLVERWTVDGAALSGQTAVKGPRLPNPGPESQPKSYELRDPNTRPALASTSNVMHIHVNFETEPITRRSAIYASTHRSARTVWSLGVTVFGIRKSARFGAKNYGYLMAVDHAGDVVWLVSRMGHTFGDVMRLSNGNILYLSFDNRAIELDMLGNTINTWIASRKLSPDQIPEGAIPVDTDTFHHELLELPGGNFAVISTEMRELDDYPSSETDPEAAPEKANVVGDVITEFKPDGTVVNNISMFDVVDPYRIGYMSLGGYWIQKGYPASKDWSHANAMDYDASDDTYIVSLRHQDVVIKIDRTSGELKWILGTPDGWKPPWSEYLLKPQADLQWQYHQHNAHLSDSGNVLLFDNGNFRAMPFDTKLPPAENYSRGVEFAVDSGQGTVTQVWSYGGPGISEYSAFLSGLRRLPQTGNVLINFGGMLCDDDGNPMEFPPKGIGWIRMIEVTGGENAELLWDLVIDERPNGMGYDAYRAERLESLYT